MLPPLDDAWDAWSPDQLFTRLGASASEWYVVGGWALDLWFGTQTRDHEDLEFAVPADRSQHYRRTLSDLEFFAVRDGYLSHLSPEQQLPQDVWQHWGADIPEGRWRIDMMVDRGAPDRWTYKRDPALSLPRTEAIRKTASGIRYLAPHLVLLFKAKHAREKDDADFRRALRRMNTSDRADLYRFLEHYHPGHVWLRAFLVR